MSIQVDAIIKQYGEQKAVNGISFSIQPGEIVGFLGPNGAGKSTTMKIITGYLQPDGGKAMVCGVDVAANPIETKKKTGYLPEANPLYLDMYVREYLSFIAGVHLLPDTKKSVQHVIDMTGLSVEAHKKLGQLSKGYKQRAGLAAALIHDPEVLILDEPTSGLDPNQIIEIRNVIREQGKNKTVLFSSHILQEVEAICDRVIIINKGQLVADDQLRNLQANNKSQSVVTVVFADEVDMDWLKGLDGVKEAVRYQAAGYRLQVSDADIVRKQLLSLAVERNLNIVSLQTETSSLESVFRAVTKSS
jgi:ABC-2 type transport system ATP-binding protein